MPTRRPKFAARAKRLFEEQDYPHRTLLIMPDLVAHHTTVGALRNMLCLLADTDLIAHWDDDDWYPPGRLSRQVEALQESGADVTASSRLTFADQAGTAWAWNGGTTTGAGTTLMYKKSFWERNQFQPVSVGEDVRFIRAAAEMGKYLAHDINGIAWRHGGNTSPAPSGAVVQYSAVRYMMGPWFSAFAEMML